MQMSTEPEQRRPRGVSGSTICLQILFFLPGFCLVSNTFQDLPGLRILPYPWCMNAPATASGNIILFIFTRHFYDREHLSSGNKNVTDTQQGQQHYNISTTLLRDTALWKLWTTPRLHHFLHYRLKNEQKIIPSTIQPQRPPWEERLTW